MKLYLTARRRAPRVLAVTGIVAAVAGVTAAGAVLPSAAEGERATALPVTRAVPTLTCPGPETLLVPRGGRAVDPGGAVVVSALTASADGPVTGRITLRGGPSEPAAQAASSPPTGVQARAGTDVRIEPGPTGVSVAALAAAGLGPAVVQVGSAAGAGGAGAGSATSAAVQSTLARSGDLRALTGTRCGAATSGAWLVGGATGGGERLRLLLANPAATPAVVDVDVRGPKGPVAAPFGDGVVVPPGAEVPVYVDALAPGLARVAVHVTARAGRVRATLHDSLMRGLSPGGADDVPTAAPAARQQVIPGVSLVNAFGKTAGDPDAAGSTSIRVAVPGTEEAVVRVRLLDGSGSVALPRTAVISVPAGGVVDVPVAGVAAGTYTAVVDADVPVVAGARVGRGPVAGVAPAAEFAWAASTAPLRDGYAVLQPGASSTLSLAAAGRAGRVRVSEVSASGAVSPGSVVDVPAGATAAARFPADAVAVRIDQVGGGPVRGAVVATVDDRHGTLISVLPLDLPAPAARTSVAVRDPRLGLR